jgi:hypothetical protein
MVHASVPWAPLVLQLTDWAVATGGAWMVLQAPTMMDEAMHM